MEDLKKIHPGIILKKDFLIPSKLNVYRFAKEIEVNPSRMALIVHGKRAISVDSALRISAYFGNSPHFWLGLQNEYDIEKARLEKTDLFNRISTKRLKKDN